ncbi:hypothetical protein [Synechococcus sp. MIT S9452]|uniref:hypothetical protein n=1 Tax=Synechococcus sp. MIT S9452 TaxID=3082546 RepID=UPI0039A5E9AA
MLRSAFSAGDWHGILEQLSDIDLAQANNSEFWFFQARAFQALQIPELGLKAWAEAIRLDPSSLDLRLFAAQACAEAEEWPSAQHLLSDLMAQPGLASRPECQILWARCLVHTGQPELAEQILLQQQAVSGVDLKALGTALVEVNLKLGLLDRARHCLYQLQDLAGQCVEAVDLRLQLLSQSGESLDLKQLNAHLEELGWPRLLLLKAARLYEQRLLLVEARMCFDQAIGLYGLSGRLAAFCFRFWVDGGHGDELSHGLEVASHPYPPVSKQLLLAECSLNAGELSRCAEQLDRHEKMSSELLLLRAKLARLQANHSQTLQYLRQWVEFQSSNAEARFALAFELLAQGQWQEAWPLYESRFQAAAANSIVPVGIAPRNSEIPPHSRNVLVFAEQGIGDSVMMASMLVDLQKVAGHVSLMVQPRLQSLLQTSFPTLRVITALDVDAFQAFDCCYGLGSLGRFFRSVPDQCPGNPYLQPSDIAARRASAWLESLADSELPRIGIAWRGGGQVVGANRRSLQLKQLQSILSHQQAAFVCLQYGSTDAELAEFASSTGIKIHALDGVGDDLDLTAALTQQLDLVITVQQTALHLAGAVGTPAWVLVPVAPEWRYGYSGCAMAWYSCVRLFRQAALNDWTDAIDQLSHAFQEFLMAHGRHNGESS